MDSVASKTKKFKWTKKLKKHYESILWLFDDKDSNRQTGRSMVLAWAYVTMAMEGREVNVIDHTYIMHSNTMGNKMLVEKILDIIKEDNLPLVIHSDGLGGFKLVRHEETVK